MLSPQDAHIVRDDSEIVGLRILLDDDALAEFAAESLALSNVVEARCDYVRYKPKRNCLARFRVLVSGGQADDFYAIAYRVTDRAKIEKAPPAIVTRDLGI